MRARSVLVLIALLAFMLLYQSAARRNEELLARELTLWTLPGSASPTRIQVGHALVLAFAFGATCVVVAWGMRATFALAGALSLRRASRGHRAAEGSYQRGLEAVLNGRPEHALESFREALQKSPDHPGALMAGADVLRSLGRPSQAVEWRLRRLEPAPDDVAALHALAEDYRAMGNVGLAAETFERVVALRPKKAVAAATGLREVLLEGGAFEGALAAHDRLVKMDAADAREPPEADAALVRAGIETRWASHDAGQGRTKEAVGRLRGVVARHPAYVPAYLALAEAHDAAGDEEAGTDALVEGFERTNDAAILVAAERRFLDRRHAGDEIERASAALEAFKRLAACSGHRPLAVAFLGRLYMRFEMLDEAGEAFEFVRDEAPDNPTFAFLAARIAERQGDAAAAAERYRCVLEQLDVLALRFACAACGTKTTAYVDRCPACSRWGSLALDLGATDRREPPAPTRPIFPVGGDDESVVQEDALA